MKSIGVCITIFMIIAGIIATSAVLRYRVDVVEANVVESKIQIQEYGEQVIRMQELNIRQSMQIETNNKLIGKNTELIERVEAKF